MFSKDKKFEQAPGASAEKLSPEDQQTVRKMLRLPQDSLDIADRYLGPQAEAIDKRFEDEVEVDDEAA